MKWIRKRSGFSPAGIITSAELTLIQMAVRLVLEATAIPFALAARRDWIERVPAAQLKRERLYWPVLIAVPISTGTCPWPN